MTERALHEERLSSNKTEALFVGLMILFLILFVRRAVNTGLDGWSTVWLGLTAFFLFYALNYRTLQIRLTEHALTLQFGLFRWSIPLDQIEACAADPTSLWRIGGAGIHFTMLAGRYRAMFNFLEHSRLVVSLKVKRGPVRDIAFSTSSPDELLRLIHQGSAAGDGA